MISFPNCKINLGLSVIEKRGDGFHNIETVLYPLPLCDILEIIIAVDLKFEYFQTGINLENSIEDNLVVKSYRLLEQNHHLKPVNIHLHKNIPTGAGLGGGSSDAAFALKELNTIFNLNFTAAQVFEYASSLGSDCPFFLKNQTVFASQRGEKFDPVKVDLSKYTVAVVKPDIFIPTKDAYSWIIPKKNEKSIKEIISEPINNWRDQLFNDFEEPIFERFPLLRKIKNDLYGQGAIYASMTGSGSALFGIFDKKINLKEQFSEYFYWQDK